MAAQGADAVPRVVTAGETMVLVVPTAPGRLRHAGAGTLSIGGAESNVAIGLSRLGVPASWVSALGEDELGELVLHRVRATGVDTSAVRRVPDRPTGRTAREARVRVRYDVNYRSRLWEPAAARAATEALLPHVDVLFVGDEEARTLWGWDEACLERLADAGTRDVVLKLGARGCAAVVDGERLAAPGFPARQLDPIGAGDAFAAGYLAATLWGLDPADRLRTANAMGAFCVQDPGDYEGLPSRRELTAFLDRTVDLGR